MALERSPEQYGKDTPEWMRNFFMRVDHLDPKVFPEHFAENGALTFGGETFVGRDAMYDFAVGFFETLNGSSHRLLGVWRLGDIVFIQGEVTLDTKAGKVATMPFMELLHMEGDLISKMQIYQDPTPLM